ncbi:MAG: PEP/pyruvate-binding domain-containing protein, partial [Candidatus Thermoplasmatota archaeon]|nr:PEP/pyruvate-binding domain-containing protein [Candidatus Thermoplasmatota archaeon]
MKESLNYLMENVLVNMGSTSFIRWFDELSLNDVSSVGGKNASLGEMFQSLQDKDINVPLGFATTAEAYFSFLKANEIEKKIRQE